MRRLFVIVLLALGIKMVHGASVRSKPPVPGIKHKSSKVLMPVFFNTDTLHPQQLMLAEDTVLILYENGDIKMPAYNADRPTDTPLTNLSGWDENGMLEKYDINDVRDSDWLKKGTNLAPTNTDTASRAGVTHVHNAPLLWTRTQSGYFGIAKPIQTYPTSPDWLFSINTTQNTGSTRNNNTVNMGFNINPGGGAEKAGFSGIGLSFEDHYEPNPGDSIAEYHTFFIDGTGAQHRLESYTIGKSDPAGWNMYHTLSKHFIKDPLNGGVWFSLNRGSATQASFQLLSSSTSRGAEFYMDAGATNLQIQPVNLLGTSRVLSMDKWDFVTMPGLTSAAINGNYYNYFRGFMIPSTDNACAIGLQGFRFSRIEACSLRLTKTEDYNFKLFEINNLGLITAHAYSSSVNSPGEPVNIINTNANGEWRIDPVSELSNTHQHSHSTITTDIVSGINGVRNDGGEITLDPGFGINILADDAANKLTIEVDQEELVLKQDISSGFYTPVISNAQNTDEMPLATEAQYVKVYDIVTVSGRISVNPMTNSTPVKFDITLPLASAITKTEYVSGIAHSGTTWYSTMEIKGNTSNNTATFQYIPKNDIDLNAHEFSYTFTYRIN